MGTKTEVIYCRGKLSAEDTAKRTGWAIAKVQATWDAEVKRQRKAEETLMECVKP